MPPQLVDFSIAPEMESWSGKEKAVLSSDCFEDKNKQPTVVLSSELFLLEFKMIPMNHFSPVTVVALWYNYTRY